MITIYFAETQANHLFVCGQGVRFGIISAGWSVW